MHSRNHSHPFMLTANTAPIKGSVHHHMVSHHQKSNDMGLTWVIVLFQTILQGRAKKKNITFIFVSNAEKDPELVLRNAATKFVYGPFP